MYSAYSARVLTGATDNTGAIFYSSQGMAIDASGMLTITTEVAGTFQAMVNPPKLEPRKQKNIKK